jgi:hypothetical protein
MRVSLSGKLFHGVSEDRGGVHLNDRREEFAVDGDDAELHGADDLDLRAEGIDERGVRAVLGTRLGELVPGLTERRACPLVCP